MAQCVISRLPDQSALCMVHMTLAPCPYDGAGAWPHPVHADDHVGSVPAVAEWATRTGRQRPLVLHHGSLACRRPAHDVDGGDCWCRPDTIPAAGGDG